MEQDALLEKLSELIVLLGFDYERMSQSGQETYTEICSVMAQLDNGR